MANIDAKLNEINDSDAWGGETTTLPPGEYQMKIKAADVESKEDGEVVKNQLVIDYEVLSGAFAGKVCKAWFTLDFTKDTPRKRLKSLVLAANIPVSPNGSFDTAQMLGCKLNVDIIHQTYMSKPDPVTQQPVEKTAVRVVNERPFRDVVASASGNGSPGVPQSRPSSGVSIPGSLPGLSKS